MGFSERERGDMGIDKEKGWGAKKERKTVYVYVCHSLMLKRQRDRDGEIYLYR